MNLSESNLVITDAYINNPGDLLIADGTRKRLSQTIGGQ